MLSDLHEAIAKVAPIVGVILENGEITIQFTPDATQDQRNAAQAIVAGWMEPPRPRLVWSLDFMDRFPESVQIAIVTAAQTNPQVRLWYDRLLASGSVDLNNQRLIAGLYAMKDAGLLTQQQIDAALA